MSAPFFPARHEDGFKPGGVWSLDMLLAYSTQLYQALGSLHVIMGRVLTNSMVFNAKLVPAAHPDLRELDYVLSLTHQHCKRLKFESCCMEVARLRQAINGQNQAADMLAMTLRNLTQRIYDELQVHKFHYVAPEYTDLVLSKTPPFGENVSAKFAELSTDIAEGAKCLALGRATASVFHLMRVMERVVQRFGEKLQITLNPKQETWYQIMKEVSKKMEAMPFNSTIEKETKERFALAAMHLDTVRLACRNDVMHPKGVYTPEEADAVFASVRTFVMDIADLL